MPFVESMVKKANMNHGKADAMVQQTAYAPADELDFSYGEDDDDGACETGSAEDTARYIADMIASLALIAREAKLDLLSYLLDMARVEAELQARQSETPFEED